MSKERIYITVDLGTTSVKVCAINEVFAILCYEAMEYSLITEGNRVEVEPETYWKVTKDAIIKVIANIDSKKIEGITITSQGETMIPVDEKGVPLYNAVVWLDNRAEEQAEKIKSIVKEEEFFEHTGVPECNGLCPVSKLLWFKEKETKIYEKTKYFLLLEDYLIFKLIGSYVTEKSLLSTTGYFNLITDCVWEELLDRIGIDSQKIPPVCECAKEVGMIQKEIATELNLPFDVRVVTGAMDQVCGAIGAGNLVQGMVTETTGTALCIGATVKKEAIETKYKIPVYRHYDKELFLLLPVCMSAGMALKWFKDNFCKEEEKQALKEGISVYDILNDYAMQAEILSGGMIFLPYLSGSIQPYYNPNLRGSFQNIGLHNNKNDFVRSIMEGIGYMLKENLLLLEEVTGEKTNKVISMGGGAKSPIWCEIKANINDILIEVDQEEEMTSIGAALLCALGLGHHKSMEEMQTKRSKKTKKYSRQDEQVKVYREGFQCYQRYLAFFSQ